MNFGAYTACVHDKPLGEALQLLRELGLDSAEINSGGFLPPVHLPIEQLRASRDARDEYLGLFASSGVASARSSSAPSPSPFATCTLLPVAALSSTAMSLAGVPANWPATIWIASATGLSCRQAV